MSGIREANGCCVPHDQAVEHVHRWWPLTMVGVGVVALFPWLRYDPVHAQWEDRASLPDCGSVALGQGETLRKDAPDELACLQNALDSGTGGELVVQWPTEEGDPIRTYHRVTPEGAVQAYEDGTADEYGSGDWAFSECLTPTSVLETNC